MRNPKLIDKIVYLVIGCWAVLAIIFAVSDLKISIAFANPESRWANFLHHFGELPGVLVVLLALSFFTANIKIKHKAIEISAKLLVSIVMAYACMYLVLRLLSSYGYDKDFFIRYGNLILLILMVLCILLQAGLYFYQAKLSETCVVFAKVTLSVAIINVVVFVHAAKHFWGRVRFCHLDSSYSQYTPWYLPQGATGHKSFPSGHAALGWMLLPLFILVVNQNRTIRWLVTSFVVAWGFAVAVSRVKIGHHYASDVLFSTCFAIIVCLLSYKFFANLNAEQNDG